MEKTMADFRDNDDNGIRHCRRQPSSWIDSTPPPPCAAAALCRCTGTSTTPGCPSGCLRSCRGGGWYTPAGSPPPIGRRRRRPSSAECSLECSFAVPA